jgi:hypothetical protein
MVLYAYHASHEQFTPSALVAYVRLAEQPGFTAVSSSERLQPWSPRQGQSGFAWAWLGAAMQATTLPFSVVCAPGPRYHPVIIAQAAATLAELFPGRFQVALGSGEALNERVSSAVKSGIRYLGTPRRCCILAEGRRYGVRRNVDFSSLRVAASTGHKSCYVPKYSSRLLFSAALS